MVRAGRPHVVPLSRLDQGRDAYLGNLPGARSQDGRGVAGGDAVDQNQVLFLDRFEAILRAYQTGTMQYGCFIAERPR